jgi:hypothetical protein
LGFIRPKITPGSAQGKINSITTITFRRENPHGKKTSRQAVFRQRRKSAGAKMKSAKLGSFCTTLNAINKTMPQQNAVDESSLRKRPIFTKLSEQLF